MAKEESKDRKQSDPRILESDKAMERYEMLKAQGLIIFEAIVGSQSYGTNLPSSDIDKKFIYIESLDNIMTGNASIQINLTKDYTGYELGRYIELLGKQNPNIIELLHADERFVQYCHPLFKELLIDRRDSFLSNKVAYSFGNYAKTQIDKAQGTNKKFMNPMDGPRKSILEFAWLPSGIGSKSLKDWLNDNYIPEEWVGLSGIDHMKYTYHIFIDKMYTDILDSARRKFDKKYWFRRMFIDRKKKFEITLGFVKDGVQNIFDQGGPMGMPDSNVKIAHCGYTSKYNGPVDVDRVQPKLSSIPKGEKSWGVVQFNLDGFQKYCEDYREYHKWLENRNLQRFVENAENEHNYDRKNMMHCHRLLDMCIEILKGEGVNVYRPNRDELIGIRLGSSTYQELVDKANEKVAEIGRLKSLCTLPDSCSKELMDSIVLEFRYRFYSIKIN